MKAAWSSIEYLSDYARQLSGASMYAMQYYSMSIDILADLNKEVAERLRTEANEKIKECYEEYGYPAA